jgi:adenylate kinase family enzyme
MRITIIGNCASGKSTLARDICSKLYIPYMHLDRFWFEGGGNKLKNNDIKEKEGVRLYIRNKVEEFIKKDSWVSDGWYSRVQPMISERADRIIFLDIPLWRRLVNHLYRIFLKGRHPELNRWDDFIFIFEIIRRTFTHGVAMKKFVKQQGDKVIHIRNYTQAKKYLDSLS